MVLLRLCFLFLALFGAMPAHAADDAGKAFGATFSGYETSNKSFPKDLELFDLNDQKVPLAFGKGQPWRLVNLWATWCGPCMSEMPALQALQAKTANLKDFQVLLVNAEVPGDAKGLKFLMKQHAMKESPVFYVKTLYLDQLFDLDGLPTTVMVNPEGQIVYVFVGGGDWTSDKAAAFFKSVLPPSPEHNGVF